MSEPQLSSSTRGKPQPPPGRGRREEFEKALAAPDQTVKEFLVSDIVSSSVREVQDILTARRPQFKDLSFPDIKTLFLLRKLLG